MGMSAAAGDLEDEYSGREVLRIRFMEHAWELTPSEDLRFGRSADLVIDDNPFMHRIVGRFAHREGVWWLQNQGARCRLELHDLDSGTRLEAAPGQQVPVVGTRFSVRFAAGPTTYELTGSRDGGALGVDAEGEVLGTATMDFGSVPLSPEQHLLIVSIYESRLRLGAIEGNSVIARRLGWTPNKFHRKLDAICEKLQRAGVPGMKGSASELAEGRRDALVTHALRVGLVGPNDLDLLRGAMGSAEDPDTANS